MCWVTIAHPALATCDTWTLPVIGKLTKGGIVTVDMRGCSMCSHGDLALQRLYLLDARFIVADVTRQPY